MTTKTTTKIKANYNRATRFLSLALIGLLTAMLLLNLDVSPAMALPIEPTDPPPDPPGTTWAIPTSGIEAQVVGTGFDWEARRRYNGGGGVISSWYWNESENRYNPEYIHPTGFWLGFNGCLTQLERDKSYNNVQTDYIYEWNVQGQVTTKRSCYFNFNFPAQARYNVGLTVKNLDGTIFHSLASQLVTVKDIFILALGDSYGSGEGAPDVEKSDNQAVRWQSPRCHRSANSAASKAAYALEVEDPKTSVTFVSFACSGATISTFGFDGVSALGDPYLPGDPAKPVGSGILGIFRGIEPVRDDYNTVFYLPSQVSQAAAAIRVPGTANNRPIDALIMSAGGNDMGFSKIAKSCVLNITCYDNPVRNRFAGQAGQPNTVTLDERIFQDFAAAHPIYDQLNTAIRNQLQPKNTFITEYADSLTGDNGGRCIRMLDDILPSPWGYFEVTQVEVKWLADRVLPNINGTVINSASRNGWNYVGGVAAAFQGHGYCASDTNRFINNADDSSNKQGGSKMDTTGTLHPNKKGYQAVADRIVAYARPVLLNKGLSLADPSFEELAVGPVNVWDSFRYRPTGSSWTFQNNAGLAANGSGFTNANPNAPQGQQVAFLQDANASASQNLVVSTGGWYRVSFQAALRANNNPQSVRVAVDGTILGGFWPTSSYTDFTGIQIYLAPGTHYLIFTSLEGGDSTVFIDSIAVNPA